MGDPTILIQVRYDDGTLYDSVQVDSADDIDHSNWAAYIGMDVREMVREARARRISAATDRDRR